jgi:hypothetical protein
MDYLTVTSIGGSIWSFRKDRIELITKRFIFTEEELNRVPELVGRNSCAMIKLIGDDGTYYCQDSYESIMERLTNND